MFILPSLFDVQPNVPLALGGKFFPQLCCNTNFCTLEIEISSRPKLMSFETRSNFDNPWYWNTLSTITFVRLSTIPTLTNCSKLSKIGLHFQPSTRYTWTPNQDWQSIVVTSLIKIEMNLGFWIAIHVFVNTILCM